MTFLEKCKSLGIDRNILSNDTGVPVKTLTTWYKTKPLLMSKLFESYSNEPNRLLNNAECVIERLKVTIDTLTNELELLKNPKLKEKEPNSLFL